MQPIMVKKSKSNIDNVIPEIGEQFKDSTNNLKNNGVDDSDKRIQALEEKIENGNSH